MTCCISMGLKNRNVLLLPDEDPTCFEASKARGIMTEPCRSRSGADENRIEEMIAHCLANTSRKYPTLTKLIINNQKNPHLSLSSAHRNPIPFPKKPLPAHVPPHHKHTIHYTFLAGSPGDFLALQIPQPTIPTCSQSDLHLTSSHPILHRTFSPTFSHSHTSIDNLRKEF